MSYEKSFESQNTYSNLNAKNDGLNKYYFEKYCNNVIYNYQSENSNIVNCRVCVLNKVSGGKNICDSCAKPKGLEKYPTNFSNEINKIKKTPEQPYEIAIMTSRIPTGNKNCYQCNQPKPNEFRSGNTTAPI